MSPSGFSPRPADPDFLAPNVVASYTKTALGIPKVSSHSTQMARNCRLHERARMPSERHGYAESSDREH